MYPGKAKSNLLSGIRSLKSSPKNGKIYTLKGDKMKNSKITIILAGTVAMALSVFSVGKTDFQKKLSRNIKIDTAKYMASIDCVDTYPINPKKG